MSVRRKSKTTTNKQNTECWSLFPVAPEHLSMFGLVGVPQTSWQGFLGCFLLLCLRQSQGRVCQELLVSTVGGGAWKWQDPSQSERRERDTEWQKRETEIERKRGGREIQMGRCYERNKIHHDQKEEKIFKSLPLDDQVLWAKNAMRMWGESKSEVHSLSQWPLDFLM